MPRANPALLQGPHHADQITSFWLAITVVAWPAPWSKARTHSEPLRIANPLAYVQRYWPPTTQWSLSAASAVIGAMKRAAYSGGATSKMAWTVPSLRPQLVIFQRSRAGYSVRTLQPSFGSTMILPPSPPAFEPILPAASSGSSSEVP